MDQKRANSVTNNYKSAKSFRNNVPETGDLADTTFHRHRCILQFITPVRSLIPSVRSPIISAISPIIETIIIENSPIIENTNNRDKINNDSHFPIYVAYFSLDNSWIAWIINKVINKVRYHS